MYKFFFVLSIFSIFLLVSGCSNGQTSSVESLSAADFGQKMQGENNVILDVRTPGEVKEGYIEGATLFLDYNAPDFAEKVVGLDKRKTYYVYCKSGGRSGNTCKMMAEKGFKVYNLAGGITGWSGNTKKD